MPLRSIGPDWLPAPLTAAQKVDERLAKYKSKQQRCQKCAASPEGDIAKKIEKIATIRQ
jgi:hypothetical protein